MGNCLIVRKSGGVSKINKVAEVKITNNGTYTLNCKANKTYIFVSTGQEKQGLINDAPYITGGATMISNILSSNIATYAHTRVALIKTNNTSVSVYGYQGFAMLFEF